MSIAARQDVFDRCRRTGKRCYVSEAKARVYANRVGKKNRQHGDRHPIHTYFCRHCQSFHLGHDPNPRPVDQRCGLVVVGERNQTQRAGDFVIGNWLLHERSANGCAA